MWIDQHSGYYVTKYQDSPKTHFHKHLYLPLHTRSAQPIPAPPPTHLIIHIRSLRWWRSAPKVLLLRARWYWSGLRYCEWNWVQVGFCVSGIRSIPYFKYIENNFKNISVWICIRSDKHVGGFQGNWSDIEYWFVPLSIQLHKKVGR